MRGRQISPSRFDPTRASEASQIRNPYVEIRNKHESPKTEIRKQPTAEGLGHVAEADERVFWVSATGLTCKDDQVHFNTEAARQLGRRYARAVVTKQNVTPAAP